MRPALLVCVFSVPLLAQFPGQYPTGGPFPGGGQYPGNGRGRNPNGTTGTNGNGRDSGRGKDKKSEAAVVTTTEGLLRRATSSQIVIEADDHRVIWYHVPDNITYEEGGNSLDPKKLAVGDHVSVDSTSTDEGVFTATSLPGGVLDLRRTTRRRHEIGICRLCSAVGRRPALRLPGRLRGNRATTGRFFAAISLRRMMIRKRPTTPRQRQRHQ
jgi:hypothetical protein